MLTWPCSPGLVSPSHGASSPQLWRKVAGSENQLPVLIQSSHLRNLLVQPCIFQMGKCRACQGHVWGLWHCWAEPWTAESGLHLQGLDGKAEVQKLVQAWAS